MSNPTMDLIYLAACAVNERPPKPDRVAAMDLDAVYALAARHMISAAAAYALESAGFRDQRSGRVIAAAVRRTLLFEQSWARIRAAMEEAGIWYLPIKGAVLKTLYPKPGMREFGDYDILFDPSRAQDLRAIMEAQGFETQAFGETNHDCYHKAPCLNFEMHRALFDPRNEAHFAACYENLEQRLLEGPGLERRFSPEECYLYLLAHGYKHYADGGTGLRFLLDSYVFLGQTPLDQACVAAQAERLGLTAFEAQNRSLALHLFGGGRLSQEDREMLRYVLSSGVYGSSEHHLQNRVRRSGKSKPRYLLSRLAVPFRRSDPRYGNFAAAYPRFYRHRLLLPLLPLYRLLRAVRAGSFREEARAVRDA